jgi:monoamine oxidase
VTSIRDAMPKDSVITNAPVTSIKQEKDTVLLTTAKGKKYEAKKAILAIMPSTYSKIDFAPELPKEKQELVAASMEGVYAKVLLSYSEPWWREPGLLGQFFSFTGPITYTLEMAVPELEQYSLAIFVAGDFAVDWFELSEEDQRKAIIDHLAVMAGENLEASARDVIEYNAVEWTNEEYIGGGPTNAMGPGMLRKYGKTLREPIDGLHFASTETAYEWKGYLEGAVGAGWRAAEEVVEALKAKKS